MKQIFEASFHNFSDNTCLGSVFFDLGTIVHSLNGQKSIAYETYSEVKQKVNALGAAINEFNLSPTSEEVPGLKMRLVGIYSKNCADWLLVDIACCMFGLTSVPLYETLNAEALTYALNHSGIQVLFCSEACCNTLVKVTKLAKLRTVIQFGRPSPELINAYKSRKITLLSFETLIEKGSMKRVEYVNVKPE
jgi:long-chain acyl-CoA synthetase